MKNGAYDYVTKPFSMEELRLLRERVSSHLKLKTENRMLREKIKSKQGFGSIVGRAPEMEKLYRIIAKAAQSTHPVLILGESGTGKEMVARSILKYIDRRFVPLPLESADRSRVRVVVASKTLKVKADVAFFRALPRQAIYSGGLWLSGSYSDRERTLRVR